jgi:hypothetical protein
VFLQNSADLLVFAWGDARMVSRPALDRRPIVPRFARRMGDDFVCNTYSQLLGPLSIINQQSLAFLSYRIGTPRAELSIKDSAYAQM